MKKYKDVIIFAILCILNLTATIWLDIPKGLTILHSFISGMLFIAAIFEFGIIYYSKK